MSIEPSKEKTVKEYVKPPRSWENPETHLETLLSDPWYYSISNILSEIMIATNLFYRSKNIKPYLFPISTGSISSPMGKGSDSLPVQIKLKGNNVYLADSMQFSLEIATRLSGNGAYYIMPTFRGEEIDSRHLNEFFHAEAEIPGTLTDVMNHIQEYVLFLLHYLKDNATEDITSITGTVNHLSDVLENVDKHFRSVRYEEAIKLLKDIDGALSSCETGYPNITPLGEKKLISEFGQFMWLTHLPWKNVPFYQAHEKNTEYSYTADLLAGIGEIIGCGQRVYSKKDLLASLEIHEVSISGYEWYGKMREIQPLQTSGFGLGIERLVLWLTQTEDIRECMLLIRDHQKICLP